MASGSYQQRGTWKTSCGRLRRYYVKTQATPTGLWLVAASADAEAQLGAALERARLAHPGQALRVDEYRRDGERIEGDRQEPVAAARAA